MMHVEYMTPVVKLNLKLECLSEIYVVIAMHTYLTKELNQ